MRSRGESIQALAELLAQPGPEGAALRFAFREFGSEFSEPLVVEGYAEAVETGSSDEIVLIGPGVLPSLGLMQCVVPYGMCAQVLDVNWKLAEAAGGALDADIRGTVLRFSKALQQKGVSAPLSPKQPLGRVGKVLAGQFAQGSGGLLFGALPVREWLSAGEGLEASYAGSGSGASSYNIAVQANVRLEPAALVVAAGFVRE